ncbi:MAG: hypothetical protein ACR2KV_08425, partial [Solirubrobacteraceae bacterium]
MTETPNLGRPWSVADRLLARAQRLAGAGGGRFAETVAERRLPKLLAAATRLAAPPPPVARVDAEPSRPSAVETFRPPGMSAAAEHWLLHGELAPDTLPFLGNMGALPGAAAASSPPLRRLRSEVPRGRITEGPAVRAGGPPSPPPPRVPRPPAAPGSQ